MNKKMIAAVMAGSALSMAASAALAGTLTDVSITLSDNRVSQPTDVTIRYTTETALSGGATPGLGNYMFVTHSFGGLTMATGACAGDVAVTVNGTTLPASDLDDCMLANSGWLQIQLKPGRTVPANAAVVIVVDKTRMTTSSTPGTYQTTLLNSRTPYGSIIDSPVAEPTYSIIAASPPAPVPTLTEWAMILLTVALGGFAALTINKRRRTV